MPAPSTSVFMRISRYLQRVHRRICSCSAPTGKDACALDLLVQEDVLAPACRYSDEPVVAAGSRPAMPAYSTSVVKRRPL